MQIKQDKDKILVDRSKGTEGFMPLWANVATIQQAKSIRDNVMDEKNLIYKEVL